MSVVNINIGAICGRKKNVIAIKCMHFSFTRHSSPSPVIQTVLFGWRFSVRIFFYFACLFISCVVLNSTHVQIYAKNCTLITVVAVPREERRAVNIVHFWDSVQLCVSHSISVIVYQIEKRNERARDRTKEQKKPKNRLTTQIVIALKNIRLA